MVMPLNDHSLDAHHFGYLEVDSNCYIANIVDVYAHKNRLRTYYVTLLTYYIALQTLSHSY